MNRDFLKILTNDYGKTPEGKKVQIFTLQKADGVKAEIINYGAIVVSLWMPDKNGQLDDVVLGFDNLEGYISDTSYQGAIVGRVGNRIAGGAITLDGVKYDLAKNDGNVNHLHGGSVGFSKVVWEAEIAETESGPALKLLYVSKDGEEGYPGTLTLSVTYCLTPENGLRIDYHATTDKLTVLNPTHHSYFNLAGQESDSILDHELMVNADRFLIVGEGLIPTGEIQDLAGTPLDFRRPVAIGTRINEKNEQLKLGLGYDHCYVLNDYNGKLQSAVNCHDPSTGRTMEVFTNEPAMQFYSGNFLDGSIKGKKGKAYQHRSALCFEPGHYPNSPNMPEFPSVELSPGETYTQTVEYRFSVR